MKIETTKKAVCAKEIAMLDLAYLKTVFLYLFLYLYLLFKNIFKIYFFVQDFTGPLPFDNGKEKAHEKWIKRSRI